MPAYEFTCITCGRTFEKNLPAGADRSDVHCPSGHRRVRRQYSVTPVLFKSSGFYVTDHRSTPSSEAGKS